MSKHHHTPEPDEGARLPPSGVALHALTRALRLAGRFRTGPFKKTATGRTVGNYFAGKRVKGDIVAAIASTLAEGLDPGPTQLPAPGTSADHTLRQLLEREIPLVCRRWDRLAAAVNDRPHPTPPCELALVPVLRLLTLDLGLRLGAWHAFTALRAGRSQAVASD